MKRMTCAMMTAGMVLGGAQALRAAEGGELPVQLINRFRVEFDDNVLESASDKQDSVNLINDLELLFQVSGDNTFLGLRYMPSFVWYSDRPDDDTDIHHQLDASLRHAFSPNVELNLKEVLRYAEVPDLIEDDVQVRQNNDFLYSSTHAGLGVRLNPRVGVDLEGRYETLGYDDSDVARRNDWDKTVGGVNLNYFLSQTSTVSAEGRFVETTYEDDIRGFTSYQGGLGLNSQLNQGLFVDLRGGVEEREYDDVDLDSTTEPYVSGGLTIVPNQATRFNLGAGYALAQTPTSRFVSQGRTSVHGGVSHDVTGRLTANASAAYSTGDFESDTAVAGEQGVDSGSEDVTRLSLRLTYEVSKSNFLEAGWQYVDLASDIRPESEYDRNRLSLGWKTILK